MLERQVLNEPQQMHWLGDTKFRSKTCGEAQDHIIHGKTPQIQTLSKYIRNTPH